MEGDLNHERLWTLKNNLRVLKGQGVGGWGSQVVGIKEGWEVGGAGWWVLRRSCIAWSTGCGAKTMNSVTLKIS